MVSTPTAVQSSRNCEVAVWEVTLLGWMPTALDQRKTRFMSRFEAGRYVS